MKKILITLALAAPVLGLHAQLYVGPEEIVTVLDGTDVFFGGVQMDSSITPGTLTINATSLATNVVINGNVLGDNRINFAGPRTNMSLNNGSWSVKWDSPNENDEELNDLTIGANGKVYVVPGNSLTTFGDFDNNNIFYLHADASGYAQLLTAGTVSNAGSLQAQQYLTADTKRGWRQISSPVGLTGLDKIADDLTVVNASTAGSSPEQYNVFWYDASPIGNYSPPGGTAGNVDAVSNTASTYSIANATHWTVAPSNIAIGPGNNTSAINIYTGGNFPTLNNTTPGLLTVDGVFGNDDYSWDCYETHDAIFKAGETPVSVDESFITGWNLIPNPYTCNINVQELLQNNPFFAVANAYRAVHVWDAKTTPGTSTNPIQNAPDLQQYRAITVGISTFTDWNTGNEFDDGAPNIPPFQAFWVKTGDVLTEGSITVARQITLRKAEERTVTKGINYFKTTPPLLRLNVVEESNDRFIDQAIIALDPSSTEGKDPNDAYKIFSPNDEVPSLYTKINGTPISINRLPDPSPSYSLPLFMDSKKNGQSYTLNMLGENLNPAWSIYLEDVKTGKMHNLLLDEYVFTHDASMKTNRFVVHINKFAGNIDVNSWNNVNIYPSSDGINVAFANADAATANITISNMSGQLIYQGEVSTGHLFTFPINDNIALYAVKVITGSKVTHDKVVR